MKDYYYILGVDKQSSTEEIKKAYRKLSLKLHPDKNEGDPFFTERFKDIQEAYEVLGEPQRRKEYENSFQRNYQQPGTDNYRNNFQPVIEKFVINPQAIYDGDEITISWEVYNSDKVEIDRLGLVQSSGTKKIKVSGMKSNEEISITINAFNSSINKSAIHKQSVKNKVYTEIRTKIEEELKLKKPVSDKRSISKGAKNDYSDLFFFVFFIVVVIITVVFIIYG